MHQVYTQTIDFFSKIVLSILPQFLFERPFRQWSAPMIHACISTEVWSELFYHHQKHPLWKELRFLACSYHLQLKKYGEEWWIEKYFSFDSIVFESERKWKKILQAKGIKGLLFYYFHGSETARNPDILSRIHQKRIISKNNLTETYQLQFHLQCSNQGLLWPNASWNHQGGLFHLYESMYGECGVHTDQGILR